MISEINSSDVLVAGGVGGFTWFSVSGLLSGGFSEAMMNALAVGLGDQP